MASSEIFDNKTTKKEKLNPAFWEIPMGYWNLKINGWRYIFKSQLTTTGVQDSYHC